MIVKRLFFSKHKNINFHYIILRNQEVEQTFE